MNRGLFDAVLNEMESYLKTRGGRGHGHPYEKDKPRPIYGKSDYQIADELSSYNNQEDLFLSGDVEVSKAFYEEDEDETKE